MPFGIKNAMPPTHSLAPCMMETFGPYMDKFLKVFVDDLNIHNMSWEEHLEHLQYVMMRLREMNLKLNPWKCKFAKTSLTFLGHVVSSNGICKD